MEPAMKVKIDKLSNEKNKNAPDFHLLTEKKIARVHDAATEVLSKTGIKVESESAKKMLADTGCKVDRGSDIVKIPRKIVESAIASCPGEITLFDREGMESMRLGGKRTYFGMGSTCIYFHDVTSGERRDAKVEDIALACRVLDALPNLDFSVPPLVVKPSEHVPQKIVNQVGFEAMVSNTTKPLLVLGESVSILKDNLDIAAAIAGGIDELRKKPFVCVVPSIISPLYFDADTLEKLFLAADRGLPVRSGSSPLSGGTAPVTTAGMLVVCIAESLAGMVITQLRSPGTPVLFGNTPGIMDMKTGNLSYSSPETSMIAMAVADMAHHYGLPVASPAAYSSAVDMDMQAALELMMSIYSCCLSGSNLISHIGGMEAGMGFSLESVILGDEIAGMVKRIMKGIPVDDEDLACEAIHATGPAGHFLAAQHTLQHFRTEQWQPTLLNRKTFDLWQQEGGKTIRQRVKEKLNEIIKKHKPKPLSDDVQVQIYEIIKGIQAR
jgi:trimethylamine--corrinoid protein Co-methyltransferase